MNQNQNKGKKTNGLVIAIVLFVILAIFGGESRYIFFPIIGILIFVIFVKNFSKQRTAGPNSTGKPIPMIKIVGLVLIVVLSMVLGGLLFLIELGKSMSKV